MIIDVWECQKKMLPLWSMKPAMIFRQYIWIINTLRSRPEGMTLSQLNEKWQRDGVAEGNQLARSSFNRHRDAIFDMFGLRISCDETTYRYRIDNPHVLDEGSVEQWLYSTLTVHGMLGEATAVRDRLLLENVPAGEEYLELIIRAMNTSRKVRMGYQKFYAEGYVKTVSPYAIKLFSRRWYLLARTEDAQMRIYAFDRMNQMEMTDERFEMPVDFSPQEYFAEYFGVLTDHSVPMAHVVVRAYGKVPSYLRTLPLHHSQQEVGQGEGYTDFSYDIRPTGDFVGQLLSQGAGIEVLAPEGLRQQVRAMVEENLKRY